MPEPEDKNADPNATPADDVTPKDEGPSKEDFNTLLGKISDLTEEVKASKPDPLIDDPNAGDPEPKPESKFDRDSFVGNMTLGDLTDAINAEVDKNSTQPLLEMITGIEVKEELKDLRKESDFNEFEKETFKIAAEQPRLSMRRCYELAKSENPDLAPKNDLEPNANDKSSNSNPPAPKNTPSEKPGVSQAAVDLSKIMTVDEAAAKAIAEELGE